MRCACIDIGSNTTRLLVADVAGPVLVPVLERRAFTRLGRACPPGTGVPAATLAVLADVVEAQAREARALGAQVLRVVATAAMRRAADALSACHALAAAAGVPVELLSEQDEARLAFVGATGELSSGGSLAVVDVGGGSSQVVVGTCADGVVWSTSLPLGSGDLAAVHLLADPPSAAQLEALRAHVAGMLASVEVPAAERVLAVGGSATSLRRLAGPRLDRRSLQRALATLVAAPAATIAKQVDIAPERARLLPAGIVVLEAIAERIGPLEIAGGGLREGVLRELAA